MAKEKTGQGTHYEPRKTQQRSYTLPRGLGDTFKEFCNGNPSTGIRGAMVIFMACEDFANLREEASRAAERMTIAAAKEKIKAMLIEAVGRRAIEEWAMSLPEGDRARIIVSARRER